MDTARPKVVLIVEDEKFMRDILQLYLKELGFLFIEAKNGSEALQILMEQSIDLVISDIHMPVKSGVELLKDLRAKNPAYPPFVFITSFSDISSEEALDLGAEAFLRKPLRKKELLEVVEKALVPKGERWSQGLIVGESARKFDFTIGTENSWQAPNDLRVALEIGQGGMFLPVVDDFPSSFEVIKVKVDAGHLKLGVLEGLCQVRWVRQEAGDGFHVGIGVEFLELETSARSTLLKYLELKEPKSYIPIGK